MTEVMYDIISCVNLVRVKYTEYLFHVILKNTNTHFTFIVVTSTNKIVINEEKQEKIVEYINCFTGEIYNIEEKQQLQTHMLFPSNSF